MLNMNRWCQTNKQKIWNNIVRFMDKFYYYLCITKKKREIYHQEWVLNLGKQAHSGAEWRNEFQTGFVYFAMQKYLIGKLKDERCTRAMCKGNPSIPNRIKNELFLWYENWLITNQKWNKKTYFKNNNQTIVSFVLVSNFLLAKIRNQRAVSIT